MKFTQDQIKKGALIALVFVVTFILFQGIIKLSGMDVKSTKPFVYSSTGDKKKRFYDWLTPMAKIIGKQYGLPWQAIAAQSALETSWGRSSLLLKYNNFAGIKDTDGKNSTSPVATKEFINGKWITIMDGFETWPSPYEGLEGYAKFIHRNKRYAKALLYPNDPYQYIAEIHKAGYATSPNYTTILHAQIKRDFNA
jgi:flagellum-specific peptidoglycan hydrolase FlgJ